MAGRTLSALISLSFSAYPSELSNVLSSSAQAGKHELDGEVPGTWVAKSGNERKHHSGQVSDIGFEGTVDGSTAVPPHYLMRFKPMATEEEMR